MIGSFSQPAKRGTTSSDILYRYNIYDDGTFEIVKYYYDTDNEGTRYLATWQQDEPGRIRILRDDESAAGLLYPMYYPIADGFEWELTNSPWCSTETEMTGYLLYPIDQIELSTGEREQVLHITPGELCLRDEECHAGCYVVEWCEDAEAVLGCACDGSVGEPPACP